MAGMLWVWGGLCSGEEAGCRTRLLPKYYQMGYTAWRRRRIHGNRGQRIRELERGCWKSEAEVGGLKATWERVTVSNKVGIWEPP